jgi:hypothetical protein
MQVLARTGRGRVGIRWEVGVVRSEFGMTLGGVAVPVVDATRTATEDTTGQASR